MSYKCRNCGHVFDEDEALLFDEVTDEELDDEKDDGSDYVACPECGSDDLIYDYDLKQSSGSKFDGLLPAIIWCGILLAAILVPYVEYAKESPENAGAILGGLFFFGLAIGIPVFIAIRKRKKEKSYVAKKMSKDKKILLIITLVLIAVIALVLLIVFSNPDNDNSKLIISFVGVFIIFSLLFSH